MGLVRVRLYCSPPAAGTRRLQLQLQLQLQLRAHSPFAEIYQLVHIKVTSTHAALLMAAHPTRVPLSSYLRSCEKACMIASFFFIAFLLSHLNKLHQQLYSRH